MTKVILFAVLVVFALWAAAARVTDMDVWWSMAAGRYILAHGAVPGQDVLSYTYAGAPWFNGEWLAQVVYFEIYRYGGGASLVLFLFAVIAAVFALAAWTAWLRSTSLVLAIAAAVLAACCSRGFFDIRAQVFSFLGTAAVMAILEAYRRAPRAWLLALLPPIMVLWVNLHYSFLFGVGMLLLYGGCEVLKSRFGLPAGALDRADAFRLAVGAVVAVLATLLNPYHVRAITEPFVVLGGEAAWRQEITEWLRPALFQSDEFSPLLFSYLLLLQVVAAILALLCDRRRVDLTDSLLVLVAVGMALSARRFIPLFALVAAPFLAGNAAILVDRVRGRRHGSAVFATAGEAVAASLAALAATVLLLLGAADLRATFAPGLFEGKINADHFPRGAVEFLRLNPIPGRLFHPYTWGGYINFQLPDRPMFIDGRAHSVYPWTFYVDQQTVQNGEAGWSEILDRWGVELIVWPTGYADGGVLEALEQINASGRWLLIYDDGHSGVFASLERARPWVDAYRSTSLVYPDVPAAQLFAGQVLLEAGAFARARDRFQAARRASAEGFQATASIEQEYAQGARSDGGAEAWFGLGFFREVNGDLAGAASAFRESLRRGLPEREAAYAREVLARLGTPA